MNNSQKKFDRMILDEPISERADKKDIKDDSNLLLQKKNIVLNTDVNITVSLGNTKIKIKDFLDLKIGSVLILDKSIQEPLNIFVDDVLIALGEIVFLEKKYGLRITCIKSSLKPINSKI